MPFHVHESLESLPSRKSEGADDAIVSFGVAAVGEEFRARGGKMKRFRHDLATMNTGMKKGRVRLGRRDSPRDVADFFHVQERLDYSYEAEDASAHLAKARLIAFRKKQREKESEERATELATRWYRQRPPRVRNGPSRALRRSVDFKAKRERMERKRRQNESTNKWYLKTGMPPVENGNAIAAKSASAWARAQRLKREEQEHARQLEKARIEETKRRIQKIADKKFRRSMRAEEIAKRRFNTEYERREKAFLPGPYINGGCSSKHASVERYFDKFRTNAASATPQRNHFKKK